MPLRWMRGKNPYTESGFQELQLGPAARPPQIVAQANNLRLQIEAGRSLTIAGKPLNATDIHRAAALLREASARAEELLLTHWPAPESETFAARPPKTSVSPPHTESVEEFIEFDL